jgi:Uma2 family endonuclease
LVIGVRLIWIVEPCDRSATVYSGRNRGIVFEDTDTLEGKDVLLGFTCKVSELFV